LTNFKYFFASRRNSRLILLSSSSLGGLIAGIEGRLEDPELQLDREIAATSTSAQSMRHEEPTARPCIIDGL
jgi:hypothetical protein